MNDRLIVADADPAAWQRALPQIIDIAVSQRQLLFVLERNDNTFRERFAAGRSSALSGQLSRLRPMAVEELGEQSVQLSALGGAQADEQLVLGGIGVPLDLLEIPLP
jgi:hypothetical protein